MFKLVVLTALVAITFPKPGYLHGVVGVPTPIVAQTYVAPAAVSSTYREDVISEPAAVVYAAAPVAVAAPIVAKTIVAEPVAVAAPIVAKTYVAPVVPSHTYRDDIISKPATVAYADTPVAAPIVAKTVAAEPVAVTAPVVSKAVVAPVAVSETCGSDIVSKPSAIAYTAPAIVSAPVVQKIIVAAPVAYSAHVPNAYSYAAHSPIAQAW